MVLGSPQAAQDAARSILSESRFRSSGVPDPLHGVLVWIGRAASDPLNALGRLVDRLGSSFPGGAAGIWVAAAVLVLIVTAMVTIRRARTRIERTQTADAVRGPRLADLERAAERAERDGRWEEAVRLRFRAGLLRLSERDGIPYVETTPNHSLARKLGSEPLEGLSRRFDEIVYGGDEASPDDAERQRRAWPEIIGSGRR
jgi:hypothetical protein